MFKVQNTNMHATYIPAAQIFVCSFLFPYFWKQFLKNLKSSSYLKHERDWLSRSLVNLKSVSRLDFFPETGHWGSGIQVAM